VLHTITLASGGTETDRQIRSNDDHRSPARQSLPSTRITRAGVFNISAGVTAPISGLRVTGGLVALNDPADIAQGGGIFNAGDALVERGSAFGQCRARRIAHHRRRAQCRSRRGRRDLQQRTTDADQEHGDRQHYHRRHGIGSDRYNGYAGNAVGGGIYAMASLVLTDSVVTNNSEVGGVVRSISEAVGGAFGGGVYCQAQLTITGTTVSTNHATGGNRSNSGGWRVWRPALPKVAGLMVGGNFSITNSTFSGNMPPAVTAAAATAAACLFSASVAHSRLRHERKPALGGAGGLDENERGRVASEAAGILASASGMLTLTLCTILGQHRPGGINHGYAFGAGMSAVAQRLNIDRCTISDNIAQGADDTGASTTPARPYGGGRDAGGPVMASP